MKHILGMAKSNLDLSGAKASKLELDYLRIVHQKGSVCDLVKMTKSSGVRQSAFEGQIIAFITSSNKYFSLSHGIAD